MTSTTRFGLLLGLFGLGACITTYDLDTAETSSSGGSPTTTGSDGGIETSGMTGTTSSADATDGSTSLGETTTTNDTSGDESTGEPASVCDPQPQSTFARLQVHEREPVEVEQSIDAMCTVLGAEEVEPQRVRIALVCPEGDGSVLIDLDLIGDPIPASPVAVDDVVRLRLERAVFTDVTGWQHIAVSDAEGNLLLGTLDLRQQPQDVETFSWFAPFDFAVDTDVCDVEPVMEPTSFIMSACETQVERAAVQVTSPWGEALVYDESVATVGPYLVGVPEAHTEIPLGEDLGLCESMPYVDGNVTLVRTR